MAKDRVIPKDFTVRLNLLVKPDTRIGLRQAAALSRCTMSEAADQLLANALSLFNNYELELAPTPETKPDA